MSPSRSPQTHHSSSAERKAAADKQRRLPWWRSGWMWVVIGIPALTLVAAIVTTMIAMDNPDPPVEPVPGERPVHIRQANE